MTKPFLPASVASLWHLPAFVGAAPLNTYNAHLVTFSNFPYIQNNAPAKYAKLAKQLTLVCHCPHKLASPYRQCVWSAARLAAQHCPDRDYIISALQSKASCTTTAIYKHPQHIKQCRESLYNTTHACLHSLTLILHQPAAGGMFSLPSSSSLELSMCATGSA